MQNQIKASNLDIENSKDRRISKVSVIWLVLREIDSIAGILLLKKYFQLNANNVQESQIKLFEPEIPAKKATFAEGTNRINAISKFIKSASNVVWLIVVWLIVVLIIGINISLS